MYFQNWESCTSVLLKRYPQKTRHILPTKPSHTPSLPNIMLKFLGPFEGSIPGPGPIHCSLPTYESSLPTYRPTALPQNSASRSLFVQSSFI